MDQLIQILVSVFQTCSFDKKKYLLKHVTVDQLRVAWIRSLGLAELLDLIKDRENLRQNIEYLSILDDNTMRQECIKSLCATSDD